MGFLLGVFLFVSFSVGTGTLRPIPPQATPQEKELGERAVKEFEGKVKVFRGHPALAKLRSLIARIVPVTERPKFSYTVKVIQGEEPNAFTFPGGYIYVTTGLLKLVRSDHELAAVLAHEVAHNTRLHALRMMKKERQITLPILLTMLASLFSRDREIAQIHFAARLVQSILLLGYSRDMEREADAAAFAYLRKAGFNPLGLLTFFERLRQLEKRFQEKVLFPGYWTTHPALGERLKRVKAWIVRAGLPLSRRPVTGALRVEVKEVIVGRVKGAALLLSGEELCRFVPLGKESALERARGAAKRLDEVLDEGAQPFDFRFRLEKGSLRVSAARKFLWGLTETDAAFNGKSLPDLAMHIRQTLTRVFLRERLNDRL